MRFRCLAGVSLAAFACVPCAALAQTAPQTTDATPTAPIPGRPAFNGVVAFGDSLSDNGNIAIASGVPITRFTTNPGLTTIEKVGAAYGVTLAPSLAGGTDFAYGGAGVTTNSPGTPSSVPTETAQVAAYLAANPRLDGRTLYSLFAGANDIFFAATALFTGQTTATNATATISAAGTQEGVLISQLHAAGAKTIVVFNLPDVGLTPQSLQLNGFIPGSAAQITGLSQAFNASLNAAVAANPGGIVPVNTFALLREVVANPAQLGFVNVTDAACTSSSSFTCTSATLRTPDAARTYLFADGVHPTAATHAIFAQVVVAELSAPTYVSLLAETPLQTAQTQRGAWESELALDGADPTTRSRLFARATYQSQTFGASGYDGRAGNDGGVVTIGADGRFGPDVSLGAAFSFGDDFANYDDGAAKFRTRSYLASVFGRARVLGQGYVEGAVGLGDVDYGSVSRSFALGATRRVERGDTGGSTITATFGGGWWFGHGPLRIGPYAQAQYERVHVDAYAEDGTDSTAMTFGAQTREALVGEFGVRAQGTWKTGFGVLAPYAALAYDHDGRAGLRSVEGGLVTLPGVFEVPGYRAAQDWGTAQVGVEARLAAGWSVYAGYHGRFADRSQNANAADVGVRRAF